ncbi:MAG: FHA domain-containing protein [Vicinamibacteria bacterium]
MILRCLVITVTRNRKGQPIRSTQLVSGDPITIGRSPQSSVFLPDPRVHLDHALIRSNDLGKLYVEAREAPLDVNGELADRAKLRRGARILIGPYEITPEPPTNPNHDFGLAVEMVQPITDVLGPLRERSRLSLAATHLSKRGLSWGLFALVAFFMLALPFAHATSPDLREGGAQPLPGPLKSVAWAVAWNPGPLSQGHHLLAAQCDACHRTPFEPVPDAACVRCHKNTGPHVVASSPSASVDLGVRCAECHRDHRGAALSHASGPRVCVDCHGSIKARHPLSSLVAVTDFGTDHPEFRLSMINPKTGLVEKAAARADQPRVEASGLKFPHARHLAPSGVRSPTGPRVLECANCHKKDEANERFQSVKMTESCSECHRLEFEPAVTTRQAPHADPALVMESLREFYARVALGEKPIDVPVVNDLLRRPASGVPQVEKTNALSWADRKAASVATDLIEHRVCIQCHEVSRVQGRSAVDPAWTIKPVRITSYWLPGANFDHRSHQQATCETCHKVRQSTTSADIAIPNLATCQTCHAGEKPAPGKLFSPCQTCHSFHRETRGGFASKIAGAVPLDPILEPPRAGSVTAGPAR